MSLEKIADEIIDTDVLVMGGGIAGCPAAAKAAEHGLKVTLIEKAKIERSGTSGQGIDHYQGAFPRGMTPKEFEELIGGFGETKGGFTAGKFPGGFAYGGDVYSDPTRLYRLYANGEWTIEELEKLGVTMRWDDGELRAIRGYGLRGGDWPGIRVHWINVKPEMGAGVRKRGVNVLDRVMIVDMLTDKGRVVGATAINTRTGKFLVIRAKATVIATGMFARCYDGDEPNTSKYKFRYEWCPASLSGDGWAAAYRAGAELANMECTGSGYRYRDNLTLGFGNGMNEGYSAMLLTWDGDEILQDPPIDERAELERKGKIPLYYSYEDLPEDFIKRIEVANVDERLVGLKISEDRGFNPRTHRYEMMDNRPNQFMIAPGISTDGEFMTSMKGLFAIGDCVAGCHDVANAACGGFLVGDDMPKFVKEAGEPEIDEVQVEAQKEAILAPMVVKDGTEPLELETAIRYACNRYVGALRSEGKMLEGKRRLGTLKRVFLPKLMAKNPHQLMRCLEVRNIINLAELHIQACLERKESRAANRTHAGHVRLDYPEKDPALDDLFTFQRLESGKPVLEMKKLKPMALPADHKEER